MAAKSVREKLKTGELKTKAKVGGRSTIWERFLEVMNLDNTSAGYVICKTCEAVYAFESHKTGTSNMVHHRCVKPQASTLASFVRRDHKKVPQDVTSKLTDACVDLCCRDLRPFDTVSGEGFHQVAQTLIDIGAKYGSVDAAAILPHRQTVCDRAKQQASIDKQKLSDDIKRALSSNGGIAITTDMWTDDFKKRAYTVLTCHFICEWQLVSRTLATVEFDPTLKKTSENLHEQITSVLTSYGIPTDKTVFVSDQGSNIKAALRSYHWIPCSAHIINTVLKHTFSTKDADVDGIQDVLDTLDYCKELVAYLKRTGAVASLKHTVHQECDVRWNSKIAMLESIRSQYQDIRDLLESKGQEHRLDGIHLDQLSHLIDFLTIFKVAIGELEGEHYPTIHMVLLWFSKLKKHCEPKFGDVPYMRSLRSRASALLDEKMRLTATHKIATFLHPKFKSLKMLTEEDRKEVIKQVRELLPERGGRVRHGGEERNTEKAAGGAHPKMPRTDFSEWEEDMSAGGLDEVEEYASTNFHVDGSAAEENLLSFWDNQSRSFPQLQHLAKRILCIPATSAASERSFSAAGRIIEARRSRLNPDTVDAILFLHSAKKNI